MASVLSVVMKWLRLFHLECVVFLYISTSFSVPCHLNIFCSHLVCLPWSYFYLFCLILVLFFWLLSMLVVTMYLSCELTWCPDSIPEAEFSSVFGLSWIETTPTAPSLDQVWSLNQNEIYRLGVWAVCSQLCPLQNILPLSFTYKCSKLF